MKCKAKAFSISREIVGSKFLDLELPEGLTIVDLKNDLFQKYPALVDLRPLYVAVNNEYADEQLEMKQGDEIALILPVNGG